MFPKKYRAQCKVISIGNLSSGGSGKTPITIALAKELQARGLNVVVSHRGYKGESEFGTVLVSDGSKVFKDAHTAGDEAYLIATSLSGIPVFAGRDRAAVLSKAQSMFPATDVVILDDAFQHIKVYRDIDVVVFDTAIGLGNGFVLPAGYLREPLTAITKDCIIVFHHKPISKDIPANELESKFEGCLHYHVFSKAEKLCGVEILEPKQLLGKKIALISAIAHPKSFEDSVLALGLSFEEHYRFPDHYAYLDLGRLEDIRIENRDYLVCTSKDAGKLQVYPEFRKKLLALQMETSLPEPFVESIIQRLGISINDRN